MQSCSLFNEKSNARNYESPVCKVVSLGMRKVLCESNRETEKVEDENGEW